MTAPLIVSASGDSRTRTLLSCALLLAGTVVLATALTHPYFRTAQGSLYTAACLSISGGISLLLLALAVQARLTRTGLWLVLAALGQAASLQLIDAGKLIHYQHYTSMEKLAATYPWTLAFLIAQFCIVAMKLRASLPAIVAWIRRHYSLWAVLMMAAVFLLSSAALSRNPIDYGKELVLAGFLQLLALLSILAAGISLPAPVAERWNSRLAEMFEEPREITWVRRNRFALMGALWVTVLAALLCLFVYENHPHLADEATYLFHARYLAEARLALPVPPVPEAFELYLMDIRDGKYFATPPAGWSMVLAIGFLLGVPWLINPVLGGINLLLGHYFLREVFDAKTARLAVVLFATSPWFIFMAMNFMMHTLTLTCALTAAAGVILCRKTGRARWAALAGLAIGFTAHIRPLDALVLGVLVGFWAIGVAGRPLRFPSLSALGVTTVLAGAMVGPYNAYLTGKPTIFPINAYADKLVGPGRNSLGFGPNRGLDFGGLEGFPGHGLPDVLVNGALNTFSLNTDLFGWVTGSLVLILLFLFSGRLQRGDVAMLVVIAIIVAAFSLYWYSGGPDFGARYWYLMLVPLIALTARAIGFLERVSGSAAARILPAVLALCLLSLMNYFPWRAVDKYYNYLLMRPEIAAIAKKYGFGKDLVLIRGNVHPDYSSAWIYNSTDIGRGSGTVYAHWKPHLRNRLREAFPDRRVWLLDGPSRTQAGYRVQGPFSPEEFFSQNHD